MKRHTFLSYFVLFGITMWFFGDLYESIVIAPNLLTDTVNRLQHWQAFFKNTNPVFYYIPIPQLSIIGLLYLYLKTPKTGTALKQLMKRAFIFIIPAIIVGIYIIAMLNFNLFFGNLQEVGAERLYNYAWQWNVLNVARIVFTFISLRYYLRAFLLSNREKAI